MVLPTKPSPSQLPALTKTLMVDTPRGVVRVRKWPRKRGKPKSQAQAFWQEFFRQASWLMKFLPPEFHAQAEELTRGTPLLPRDVLMMSMVARLWTLRTPDGEIWYPRVFMNEVSKSLDALSKVPGSVLVRGNDVWFGLAPGEGGTVLTIGPEDGIPTWLSPTAGPGFVSAAIGLNNPSFETGDLSGWEVIAYAPQVQAGGAFEGNYRIRNNTISYAARIGQTQPIPEAAFDAIDAGAVTARVNWAQGDAGSGGNKVGVRLNALDAVGGLLLSTPSTFIHRITWRVRQLDVVLPAGTRQLRLETDGKNGGTGPFNGLWDAFTLQVFDTAAIGTAGVQLPSFLVSLLPNPDPPGRMIYVLNASPSPTPAFSDGLDWRRVDDGTVIA